MGSPLAKAAFVRVQFYYPAILNDTICRLSLTGGDIAEGTGPVDTDGAKAAHPA